MPDDLSVERALVVDRWRAAVTSPPDGWRPFAERDVPFIGYDRIPMFEHSRLGLAVGLSIDPTPSGQYVHVSLSHRSRVPYWHEVRIAKDTWIGPDRDAVHAIPRASEHVNRHDYTLHLWSRLDRRPILDPVLGLFV